MVEPIFDYQFRLILIGDSTVGKSSLLRSFTDGKFSEISDPTVGVDFFARLIELKNGLRIKLQLWDTAGQERFRSITRSYYRNSVGAMVVYDTSSRQSFEHVGYWVGEARRHIAPHKAVFILVGAKVDLDENRQVPVEEARALANFHGMLFMETSSKTGWHVEEAFREVAVAIYDKLESGEYKLEDGWDGIKGGYHTYSDYRIAEAEPTRPCC